MKLGAMKGALADSLAGADRVLCLGGGIGWDVGAALAPLGARASVASDVAALVEIAVSEARAGDRLLVMSNGSFGGIHARLIERLAARARRVA
jgi:UDP-N-acetylmuramate: L-alanyl-gamma-D-glutamyl-meso-diaminopimelate ligase